MQSEYEKERNNEMKKLVLDRYEGCSNITRPISPLSISLLFIYSSSSYFDRARLMDLVVGAPVLFSNV